MSREPDDFSAFRRSKDQRMRSAAHNEDPRETDHRVGDGHVRRLLSGRHGELDWSVQDEELDEFAMNLIDSVDTILYGRATYQLMAGYWPRASGSFAERTNRLP